MRWCSKGNGLDNIALQKIERGAKMIIRLSVYHVSSDFYKYGFIAYIEYPNIIIF